MSKSRLNVKGILFDLDGTILDTKPAYIEAAKEAFLAIGQAAPQIATAIQIPKRIEQQQPLSDLVQMERKAFLDVYLKAFYRVSPSKTVPFPNVASTLEALSQKAKLALITMRFAPRNVVISELEQFHLDQYFAHVVTALDTYKPKPSPEGLIKAVEALNISSSQCLIVGDSVVDVKAGKAAGTKTVAVLSGLYSREELLDNNPDFIINDISELPSIIN
jgi:HAD superfamily hydrolase (TIGR01509 family)